MMLDWQFAGQPWTIVPSTNLYPSHAVSGSGNGLSATYADSFGNTLQRTDAQVDFDWGVGSPDASIAGDDFTARWEGSLAAPLTGTLMLGTLSDDGVRVWIDDALVIDNWTDHAPWFDACSLAVEQGHLYRIRIDYYERGGGATMRLFWRSDVGEWQPVPTESLFSASAPPRRPGGNGLLATYFDNADFSGASFERTDATVDFDWGVGSPDPAIDGDTFSVAWEGEIVAPVSGDIAIGTVSDDGVRVWVDGSLVIDDWGDHAPLFDQATLRLEAGARHRIRIEYYENGGGAVIRLLWQLPGADFVTIPESALFAPRAPNRLGALPSGSG